MHLSLSRAFQRHQHNLKHTSSVNLISTNKTKQTTFLHRQIFSKCDHIISQLFLCYPSSPLLFGYKGSNGRSKQRNGVRQCKVQSYPTQGVFKLPQNGRIQLLLPILIFNRLLLHNDRPCALVYDLPMDLLFLRETKLQFHIPEVPIIQTVFSSCHKMAEFSCYCQF
jgi:hypothetical protein